MASKWVMTKSGAQPRHMSNVLCANNDPHHHHNGLSRDVPIALSFPVLSTLSNASEAPPNSTLHSLRSNTPTPK